MYIACIYVHTHTHIYVYIYTHTHMLGLDAYYIHLTITKYHVCRVHTHGTLSPSALRERWSLVLTKIHTSFGLTKLHTSLGLTKLHTSYYTPQCRINTHCTLSP
jgi:hypothetical protein